MRLPTILIAVLHALASNHRSIFADASQVAIRDSIHTSADYRTALAPERWELILLCTCASPVVASCPSAGFQWIRDSSAMSNVVVQDAVYAEPAKIFFSSVSWPNTVQRISCDYQQMDNVSLSLAVFNITAADEVVTKLDRSFELRCTFRTNMNSVLSMFKLQWYRSEEQLTDSVTQLNMNASLEIDLARWTPIVVGENPSENGKPSRYAREDKMYMQDFDIPMDGMIVFTKHYLMESTLRVLRVSSSDVLPYRCVYTLDETETRLDTPAVTSNWSKMAYATATLYSKPFLTQSRSDESIKDEAQRSYSPSSVSPDQYSSSITVYEGDSFTLDCYVFGLPTPRVVSWSFCDAYGKTDGCSQKVLFNVTDQNDNISVSAVNMLVEDWSGIENGRLRVSGASYDLRGRYQCVAQNEHGWAAYIHMVRVKNPNAFMYPLIGIVIELAVLASLIVFFERRGRRAFSKNDALTGASVTDDDGYNNTNGGSRAHSSELRQRMG